ncbi:MAG: thiol:disulfide interchange protein DsbD [Oceanicoccus sp.]|jgi:thiol:disulfide interchange protein DsbD
MRTVLILTAYWLLTSLATAVLPNTATAQADFGSKISNDVFSQSNNGLISEDEFLAVEQAYILNAEFIEPGKLRLNWQIADTYYLYRHGFSAKLSHNGNTTNIDLEIPKGLEKQDEYFGQVEVYYHNAELIAANLPRSGQPLLTVTSQGCADAGLCYPPRSQYFQLDGAQLTVTEVARSAATQTSNTPAAASGNLATMLLLAMLGGIILNLMPCVFPVLSLKVLAFANDKQHSQSTHGLAYAAGVILSFIAVAATLISLQAAGEAIGWGFHLQSSWFVAALAWLFFVMGLSLSGYIELGGGIMNVGADMAQKPGYSGSFFTGILATVVASPCTAPFMGTALGFAITQPTAIALLVFAALGFGMALPVVILSFSPRLLNKIPKPGLWMEKLKQVLAFPLYATAIWLCWVVGKQNGVNAMAALLVGAVLLTLALWLWRSGIVAKILAVASVAAALSILPSSLLQGTSNTDQNWQTYDPATLEQLRQHGQPVFINITADWCITCLANEKVTLNTAAVKQAMVDAGISYLKGDWTTYDPQITALLERYGRTGIPLYLLFPAGNNSNVILLPQILNSRSLIEALQQAGQSPLAQQNPQL